MPLRRFFRFSWAFVFVTPMDEPQMSPLMPTLDQALNWSSSQWVEYVGRLNSKQAQCVFKKGWSECYPQLKTSDTLKSGSDQTIKIRTLIQKFKKWVFKRLICKLSGSYRRRMVVKTPYSGMRWPGRSRAFCPEPIYLKP